MELFRNPEIKRSVMVYAGVTAGAAAAAGIGSGPGAALLCAVLGAVFLLLHLLITWKRYRKIAGLSGEIDRILHGEDDLLLSEYEEGELAILHNELCKVMKQMREQKERLQRDKTYLSDSLADISHQIRTPLTSIHLLLAFLRAPDLSEERRYELVGELTKLLDRIDYLISNLLKISRLDTGTARFRRERVEVKELIRLAAEPLEVPMELRGQRLEITAAGQESYEGDLSWSAEALGNILKNCMEHTPDGGLLRIKAEENAIYTEIVVTDTGTGIDPEDLPHLFERFYKGKYSGGQNFGIGLALARMIVTEQNGIIKAGNGRDGGACFTIRFYRGAV